VAEEASGALVDYRMPMSTGIAGRVATTGRSVRVDDAYTHADFNPEADQKTGYRTHSILCVPILDSHGEVFAVAELLNHSDGRAFDPDDEARFRKFIDSIGVILEAWWQMSRRQLRA
jgi:adenylate cyclase